MTTRLAPNSAPGTPTSGPGPARSFSGSGQRFPFRGPGMGMTPFAPPQSPLGQMPRASSAASLRGKSSLSQLHPDSVPQGEGAGSKTGAQQRRRRRYNDTRDIDVLASEISAENRIMRSRAASGAATPMRAYGEMPVSPSSESLVAPDVLRNVAMDGSRPQSPYSMTPYNRSQSSLRGGAASSMSLHTLPTRPGPNDSSLSLSLMNAFSGVSPSDSATRRFNLPQGMEVGFNDNPYPMMMRSRTDLDLIPPMASDASSIRSQGVISPTPGAQSTTEPGSPRLPSSPSSPVLVMSMNDPNSKRNPRVPSTRRSFLRSLNARDSGRSKSRLDSARSLPSQGGWESSLPSAANVPRTPLEPVIDSPHEASASNNVAQPPPPQTPPGVPESASSTTLQSAAAQAPTAQSAPQNLGAPNAEGLAPSAPQVQTPSSFNPPSQPAPVQSPAVSALAPAPTSVPPPAPELTAPAMPAASPAPAAPAPAAPAAPKAEQPTQDASRGSKPTSSKPGKNTAAPEQHKPNRWKRGLSFLFRRKKKNTETRPPLPEQSTRTEAPAKASEPAPEPEPPREAVAAAEAPRSQGDVPAPDPAPVQAPAHLPTPTPGPETNQDAALEPPSFPSQISRGSTPMGSTEHLVPNSPSTFQPNASSTTLMPASGPQPAVSESTTPEPAQGHSDAVSAPEPVLAAPALSAYDLQRPAQSTPPTQSPSLGLEGSPVPIAVAIGDGPQAISYQQTPLVGSDAFVPVEPPADTKEVWHPFETSPHAEQVSATPEPSEQEAPTLMPPITNLPSPIRYPMPPRLTKRSADRPAYVPPQASSDVFTSAPTSVAPTEVTHRPEEQQVPVNVPETTYEPTERLMPHASPQTLSIHGHAFDEDDDGRTTPVRQRTLNKVQPMPELTERSVDHSSSHSGPTQSGAWPSQGPSFVEEPTPYGGLESQPAAQPAGEETGETVQVPTYLGMSSQRASPEDPQAVSMSKLASLIEQTMAGGPLSSSHHSPMRVDRQMADATPLGNYSMTHTNNDSARSHHSFFTSVDIGSAR